MHWNGAKMPLQIISRNLGTGFEYPKSRGKVITTLVERKCFLYFVNRYNVFAFSFVKDYTCSMMDQCPPALDEEEVYEMLMYNFRRHYDSNRAPFGLYFHTIWFKSKINMNGFEVCLVYHTCFKL